MRKMRPKKNENESAPKPVVITIMKAIYMLRSSSEAFFNVCFSDKHKFEFFCDLL